jgi:hypothetical protein
VIHAQATPITFLNPSPITIPTSGNATPYPSTLMVSSVTGPVVSVAITLHGFSHTFPDDVGILLVGPTGAGSLVFDGGTTTAISGATLTFMDGGAPWPNAGPVGSGTYQPRSSYIGDIFPAPAPLIPGENPTSLGVRSFSVFNGLDPNGTWSLYITDFATGDSGTISGGWSLQITAHTPIPEPATLALFGLGVSCLLGYAGYRRTARSRQQARALRQG